MARNRMTWSGRTAGNPPAVPGYGEEDQDHPAHKPEPQQGAYAKGSPSEWGEDVRKPPYPQGNPPADPGYDVEDQDHPAHISPPRNPKSAARGLQAAIIAMTEAKAAKCLKLASHMLKSRRGVTAQMIEDQAFSMMDWPDSQIRATAARFGGDFLADELDGLMGPSDPVYMDDDDLDTLLAEGDEDEIPPMASGDDLDGLLGEEEENPFDKSADMETLAAQVQNLTEQLQAMKRANRRRADQNDPDGETLAPTPKSEDEARKESSTRRKARAEVRKMATVRDGFIFKADWKGPARLFKAADKDKDDIVSEDEVVDEMTAKKKACGDDMPAPVADLEDAGFFAKEEQDALGNPVAMDEDDAILEEIFGGRVAKKAEDEDDESESEEEESEEEDEGEKAEDESEEEDEGEKASKKAEEEEPKEEEEEKTDKAARRTAARQRPQPRKPSQGLSRVGSVGVGSTGEISELSRLWETKPDVSEFFGK